MKRFLVENKRKSMTIKVMVHNPPYEDADVISRTKLKLKDVKIKDVTQKYTGEE